MNRRVASLFLAAALLIVGLAPTAAYADPSEIVVTGRLTHSGISEAGFTIAVSCSGKLFGNFLGFAVTNATGNYELHTNTTLCPLGSTVEARADKDGDGKFETSASAKASPLTYINIELGVNATVPEFGAVEAISAASIGVGLVVLVRRRYVRKGMDAKI